MIDNHTICLNIETDLTDNATGLVVIDSLINNTSSGGVRISDDISREEVRTLAREMTLKYSFVGLPRGGAKSGVKIPAGVSTEVKRRILEDFGRKLSPIITAGIYYPGMDMNCGPEDLRAIYKGAGFTLGQITDTSYFTAISVANAIYACRDIYGLKGKPLTVAIEGFGSVGSYLAERLLEDDYRIVAVSTIKGGIINNRGFSVETLLKYRKEFGDNLVNKIPDGKAIQREEILIADVDILVPSARTWVIDAGIAKDVKARFIVPVANAPYTREAIDILHDRGIICLPGFVTNSGGVYASSLYDSSVGMNNIEAVSNIDFRGVVKSLLEKSRDMKLSPVYLAGQVAFQRFARKKMENSPPGMLEKGMKKAFGKGLLPKSIYGRLRLKEFKNNLALLKREIEDLRTDD